MSNFLDQTGLTYFWGKIKAHFAALTAPRYGECSTRANVAAKTVTINGVDELTTGLTIMVKFTNSNTKSTPTLKVNDLDAKEIKRYGTTAPSTSAETSWNAGSVIILVYDGTYWQMCNFLNSTYTIPSAMTASEMQTGTATTGRTVTAERLKAAVEYHSLVPKATVNDEGKSLVVDYTGAWAIQDPGYAIQITEETPLQSTPGITVNESQTSLKKYGRIVECKVRFQTSASILASETLFMIPQGFRPLTVIRPIVHDWNLGQARRFNIFSTGEFQSVDSLPSGLTFIITVMYLASE